MIVKSKFLCGLLALCLFTFIMLNQEKAQQLSEQKREIQQLERSNTNLKQETIDIQQKYIRSQQALTKRKAIQSNDPNSRAYQNYQEATEKVFTGLFTFKPTNYRTRQKIIRPYLSEQLNDRYFGNNGHYGDGNHTTSTVLSLHIYNRTIQKDSLDGVVVVTYQSKIQENAYQKATEFFEVSFDVRSGKMREIQSLGTTLKGELLE